MDIEKDLTEHLKRFTTAPFLFIGSGFSRRYLGTESWEGLIRKFCELVPREFAYYKSTSGKQWDIAAQMIAEDFHEIWWSDPRYSDSRNEFGEQVSSKFSPLKIEISKYLREKEYEYGLDPKNDSEIEALKDVVIDGIITTNWDSLIESIFTEENMTTYIGQKKLLFSNPLEVNEIYKIHGCSSEPDSLVLTKEDYNDFNGRNAYLAAKLLTIFIEHPVVFIGYSLSDKNITQILESITACLDESNISKLKDRLIFVERAEGSGDNFHDSTITVNGLTIPITKIRTDDYDKVYRSLSKIKRKFSTKKLRQMKSEMYELIKHNDPKGKIQVVEYDGDYDDNIEFVVGFGMDNFAEQVEGLIRANQGQQERGQLLHANKGYSTYSRKELLTEIVADTNTFGYNYDDLLKNTLPEKLKSDQQIPVNKFIKYSNIDFDALDYKIAKRLDLEYKDFLTKKQQDMLGDMAFEWQFSTIDEVIEGHDDLETILFNIPLLGEQNIEPEKLRQLLVQHIDLVDDRTGVGRELRRLFKIYDYLAFGNKSSEELTSL